VGTSYSARSEKAAQGIRSEIKGQTPKRESECEPTSPLADAGAAGCARHDSVMSLCGTRGAWAGFTPTLRDGRDNGGRGTPDFIRGYFHGLPNGRPLGFAASFGVKRHTLMRMQSAYEIAQTRKREKLIRVRRVVCAA
jgi:hypothetical protein